MSDSSDELTSGQAENPRDRLSEVEEQLEHVQRGAVLRTQVFGELKFVHSFVLQKWGFKSTSRAFHVNLCEHLHFPRSLHHYQRSNSLRIPPHRPVSAGLSQLSDLEERVSQKHVELLNRFEDSMGPWFFSSKVKPCFPPHQMGKNGHLVVKWFFITLLLWICQREKGWQELWLTGHTQRNPPTCWDFFHKFMNNLRKTWFKNMWPSWIGVCWWRIQWGF